MRIPFVEQFAVVGQFFVFSRLYKVPDYEDTGYDSKDIDEDGDGRVAKKMNLAVCRYVQFLISEFGGDEPPISFVCKSKTNACD